MLRVLVIVGLLLPVSSVAHAVAKNDILKATSDIQKSIEGTDQLRLRVNRYCHITITHEPEEALLRVISTHVLSQKYEVPASEMLYVIRASVATEGQLLLWAGDCAPTGERQDDRETMRLSSQIMGIHRSLHNANERFWDLLAEQIAAEERITSREQ